MLKLHGRWKSYGAKDMLVLGNEADRLKVTRHFGL